MKLWTALSCSVLFCACSCAPLTPQEKSVAADSAYLADMLQCVDKAETLAASKACRVAARAAWDAGTDAPK